MGRITKITFSFFALSCVTAAQAQGVYLRADAGVGMMNSFVGTTVLGSPPAPPGETAISQSHITVSDSVQWQAGIGYAFDEYWRIDLTAGQSSRFGMEGACIPSNYCPPIEVLRGHYSSTQAFVNGYLELAKLVFGEQSWFHPYIGVGLGYAHNELSQINAVTRDDLPISNVESSSANDFAWRAIGGLAFEVTENFFVDFSYSYMDLGDLETGKTVDVVLADPDFVFDLLKPFTTEMVVQEVLLGLRYQF